MPVVEPLASHHDRKSFDCGVPSLNEFLQRDARQNADRNVGVTHVVVPAAGSARILGYYTLVTRTIESTIIPDGRMAVDLTCRGEGFGARVLLRAIRQTEMAARDLGIFALVVDALDDMAREWYLHLDFGFQALADDPKHLFLPVETIRQLEFGRAPKA